jgi:hypothetical protein
MMTAEDFAEYLAKLKEVPSSPVEIPWSLAYKIELHGQKKKD